MMVAAAIGIITLVVTVMMVMMMLRCLCKACELLLNGIAALHGSQQLCAVQLIPRSGDDSGGGVVRAQKRHGLGNLLLIYALRMGEHDTARVFDLIVEELAEVFHIHLALFHVGNRGESVEDHLLGIEVLHRSDNVGQLADTGGLDEDAVGVVLVEHLVECLAEVAHERAADAATVHFGHLNACVLHKAAINADLTELVFDQHQLLSRIRLL